MEDNEQTQEEVSNSVDGGVEVVDSQELSTTVQWTTFTTRKQQAAAKKHKAIPSIDVDQLHKDGLRDPAFCKLHETGIDELSMAFNKSGTEKNSPTYKLNYQQTHQVLTNVSTSNQPTAAPSYINTHSNTMQEGSDNRTIGNTSTTKTKYAHEL
jgi:hypothetical protein